MDTTANEKAMRLHDMLKEALTPITEKLEKMEQEIKILKENQVELKRLLTERPLNNRNTI
jgi:hypothetical protein